MTTRVYSAMEHSFSFAGVPNDSGRGPDEFVSWEQKEDNFSYKAGVDGEGTYSENKDDYTELTLTIMQSSTYNDYLSGVLKGDITLPGGAGIATLLVRDRQGTTLLMSTSARILGWPKQSRGKEVGTNQWKFGVPNPQRFDGGN